MKIGIVSDVHGRKEKLYQALLRSGFIYADWSRAPKTHLIQIGDLVSLGYDEQEADFYEQTFDLFDETLIGNHEIPAFHFDPHIVMFDGFYARPSADRWTGTNVVKDNGWKIGADPAATMMVRSNFFKGKYKVATSVGKWLITHAGVSPFWQKKLDKIDIPREASAYVEYLENKFIELQLAQRNFALIDGIPSNRGGPYKSNVGGILWLDFNTLRAGYSDVHLPQLVCHSHQSSPPTFVGNNLVCIDTNKGVCVLTTEDNGESFTSVVIN